MTSSLRERYHAGMPFPDYLETVRKNKQLWKGIYERARLPDDCAGRAKLSGPMRLLALSEDWCGDAANILPFAARLAEEVDGLDLRVLSRDENLDIMDAHLTGGRSRSIPIILLLDEDYAERAWWGPRPRELQEWVMKEGMRMEPGPRYREVRRRYARDKGKKILDELLSLIRKYS